MILYIIIINLFIYMINCTTLNINWSRTVGNIGTKTISVGDTVTWTISDTAQHTVTSNNNGFTSSGTLSGSGTTYSIVFNTIGTYQFHCSIHTNMMGTISVSSTPTIQPTTNIPTYIPSIKPTTLYPTKIPTISPTKSPLSTTHSPTISLLPTQTPTFQPSHNPTLIPTYIPSVNPTIQPTLKPTSTPTSAPTDKFIPFISMPVIQSNSSIPTNWNATIEIREHRHINSRVGFNTRSYCYNNICTYPGPTISLKPGDNFTLIVKNNLGPDTTSTIHKHNTIHSPNTTNVHTHGLHISPSVDNVFLFANPGDTLTYNYQILSDHSPGLHWYHAHYHGSSTLQIMNGLVGALNIENIENSEANIPDSLINADVHIIVLTRLIFKQETQNGEVTQGCGINFKCNTTSQSPLCTGTETTSPWNPFRVYSLPELSAESGSKLNINSIFYETNSPEDYILVNGLYHPTIQLYQNSPSIFKILHAHGAGPIIMSIYDNDNNQNNDECQFAILAWDGVYLKKRIIIDHTKTINLVAAGRVEVEIFCTTVGTYKIVENGQVIFYVDVQSNTGELNQIVTDEDLNSIVRPWYLNDLCNITDNEINSTYSVFITQENFNEDVCGFWIGVGSDCSVISPYGSALPNTTMNNLCGFHQFQGKKGLNPTNYYNSKKLITFVGAINEWTLYGLGSAYHPLHVHVNHMQIISWNSTGFNDVGNYYEIGQWRDTIPPIADSVKFRFRAANFPGETVMHCHFQRHEDLGMMDTYLVMNETAYEEYLLEISPNYHHHDDKGMIDSNTVMTIGISVGSGVGVIIIGGLIYLFHSAKMIKIIPS